MTSQYETSRKWVLHVNGSPTRTPSPNSTVKKRKYILKYENSDVIPKKDTQRGENDSEDEEGKQINGHERKRVLKGKARFESKFK